MILLVPIAIAIWALAAHHRRRPAGFLIGLGALLALVLINVLHAQLARWTEGRIEADHLRMVMYPYTVLVPAVAWYIALLPRAPDPSRCSRCRYDLRGLRDSARVCPECGTGLPTAAAPRYRPSGTTRRSLRADDGPRQPGPPDTPPRGAPPKVITTRKP